MHRLPLLTEYCTVQWGFPFRVLPEQNEKQYDHAHGVAHHQATPLIFPINFTALACITLTA